MNVVKETLQQRTKTSVGIIEESRLFNNLLSSQPLCFNFFGELYADKNSGLTALQAFYPDITKLRKVMFEFAPPENFTKDRSAFDIAFEVEKGNEISLIGLECKYTDTFSYKPSKLEIFYGDKGNKNYETYFEMGYSPPQIFFIFQLTGTKSDNCICQLFCRRVP